MPFNFQDIFKSSFLENVSAIPVLDMVLVLGMVGALSIVRFRTAIKDPSDIAFLFWNIAAGLIPLAVFGSLFIGLILLIFFHSKGHKKPYILVVHCEDAEGEKIHGSLSSAA